MKKYSVNNILLIMTLFFCLVVAYIASSHTPFSFDSFWLLRMGDDVLSGINPLVDYYSFTHNGQDVKSPYLIMPIILSAFVSAVGVVKGFQLYVYGSFVLFFILTSFLLHYKKCPWFVFAIILPLVLFFVEFKPIARPELLSYSLIIVCLYLYDKAQKEFSHKNLFYISIILLLWVNYHTPIFGYIIVFGLFLEKAIFKIKNRNVDLSWMMWMLWGVIIFCIGFLNINMEHFIVSVLSLSTNNWKELITEYHPAYSVYLSRPYMQVLWLANVCICLFLLVRKQYGYFFICTLLLINGFLVVRLVHFSFIINLVIFSMVLGEAKVIQRYYEKNKASKIYISTLWLSSFLFVLLFSVSQAFTYGGKDVSSASVSNEVYPVDEVAYLREKKIENGKILNQLQMGGFLAYNLSPKYSVYIDGRTNILYSFQFVKKYLNILGSSKLIKQETEKYNIDYALFDLGIENYYRLYNTGLYDIDYVSKNFMLLTTESPNFPVVGNIMMQPACLFNARHNEISKEIVRGRAILSQDSALMPVINMLDGYLNDDVETINKFKEIKASSPDYIRRIAAYMALNKNDYISAAAIFSSILDKRVVDIMMISYSFYYLGKYSESEEVLKYLLTLGKRKKYNFYESIMLFAMAKALDDKNHLGLELKGSIPQFNNADENMELPEMSLLPSFACYSPNTHD